MSRVGPAPASQTCSPCIGSDVSLAASGFGRAVPIRGPDPVACTPASGWEKGQVENQVGLVRERFFTPRLRFKNYDEMNAWLTDQCIAYAKAHRHPELTEQTSIST